MSLLDKITAEHFAWFNNEIAKPVDNSPKEAKRPLEGDAYTTKWYQKNKQLKDEPSIHEVHYWEGVIDQEEFHRQTSAVCHLEPFTINPVTFYKKDG